LRASSAEAPTVYAATKAFVLSFSEGLSEELRDSGVRVQVLCPGITATGFLDVAETHGGLLVSRMPMLSADDVVQASLRVASRLCRPAPETRDAEAGRS
jgi:short-subunit dehydrogenase